MADVTSEVELPDGWVPVEQIVVWKALDGNGVERLYYDKSNGLTPWEAVGMATFAHDGLRLDLQAAMMEDDEDDA